MKTNQKGFITTSLLIIAFLALLGTASYIYFKSDATNKCRGQSKCIEIEEWKTYKNEKYGFEIKYPSDYNKHGISTEGIPHPDSISFSSESDRGLFILIPLPISDEISKANPKATSLDDYKKNYKTHDVSGYDVVIKEQRELTINGVSALRQKYSAIREYDDLGSIDKGLRYVFFNNNNFIIISTYEHPIYEEALDNMAKTFKFTK